MYVKIAYKIPQAKYISKFRQIFVKEMKINDNLKDYLFNGMLLFEIFLPHLFQKQATWPWPTLVTLSFNLFIF